MAYIKRKQWKKTKGQVPDLCSQIWSQIFWVYYPVCHLVFWNNCQELVKNLHVWKFWGFVQLRRKFHQWLLTCWQKPIWVNLKTKEPRVSLLFHLFPPIFLYFYCTDKVMQCPFLNIPWVQIFISKFSFCIQEFYQFLCRKGNNYNHIRYFHTVFTRQPFPLTA